MDSSSPTLSPLHDWRVVFFPQMIVSNFSIPCFCEKEPLPPCSSYVWLVYSLLSPHIANEYFVFSTPGSFRVLSILHFLLHLGGLSGFSAPPRVVSMYLFLLITPIRSSTMLIRYYIRLLVDLSDIPNSSSNLPLVSHYPHYFHP